MGMSSYPSLWAQRAQRRDDAALNLIQGRFLSAGGSLAAYAVFALAMSSSGQRGVVGLGAKPFNVAMDSF